MLMPLIVAGFCFVRMFSYFVRMFFLFCQEFVADPDDDAGSDYVCYVDGEAINMDIEDGT